ncbi:MFS transporter [Plantactinospora endophytica]|uniref:MFS transporter n=1 Tax=Plantactinospora endophytica TaxID=673535 RepID=A0ABQ4E5G5_9ACTN|nr:MFS transporter [Plantactinospora endophytica]
MTRPLLLAFVASAGAMVSFYLLLTVVPLYATSTGAGDVGAGLVTGTLMLSTVLAELAIPRLAARFGQRSVLLAGLLLLGAPALLLLVATGLPAILLVCFVRGLGFAVTVVLGSALVAELAPAQRRGEALGLYGVVVGIPGIIGLPVGVWLVDRVGYPSVFVLSTLAALAGLAAATGLPGRRAEPEQPLGMLAGLRNPALTRPATAFAGVALASGIVVTFLPSVLTDASVNLIAFALLAQAVTTPLTRWWAGRYLDRHPDTPLLAYGVVVSASGVAILAVTGHPVTVVVGMLLFGAGFGVAQCASLTGMLRQVSTAGYGTVSAVWNLAFDAGIGLGAAGFGLVAAGTGYPAALGITVLVMLSALAALPRRRQPAPRP